MISRTDRQFLHVTLCTYENVTVRVWDCSFKDHVRTTEQCTHDQLDSMIDWCNLYEGDVMEITWYPDGEVQITLMIGILD